MIERIPLRAEPGQSFLVVLADQNCSIRFTQRNEKTYCDMMVDNDFIWQGLICQDRSPILKHKSAEFVGNLVFLDLEGTDDPNFNRLDDRWILLYISDDVVLSEDFQQRGTERR